MIMFLSYAHIHITEHKHKHTFIIFNWPMYSYYSFVIKKLYITKFLVPISLRIN